MSDTFRPRHEPARTIYDALQSEAAKREGRTVKQWQRMEVMAVWQAAHDYAHQYSMRIPTMDDIERADRQACGHIDYAAKLAYGIAAAMRHETAVEEGK